MRRVAFQGEIGAYSEAAVREHFGPEVEAMPGTSFDAVFEAVEAGACDCGLIPIENSLAGSIHRNYDLLLQHELCITGEHYLRVRHCLIAHPGVALSNIRKVISHPQALAQCDRFLRGMPGVQVESVYDTAGSVKLLKESGEIACAAIASSRAALVYGMQILAEGIEDDSANYTRFLSVAREAASPGADAKTSIVFSLNNVPGALFKALSVFALRDLDLTKIESRPLVGTPWDYLFYIDFIGSTENPVVTRAINHLSEYALMLRVLGSYPRQRIASESL